MLRSMYASVSSMLTLQARQSAITNNLANINTTGYKAQSVVTKSFPDNVVIAENHIIDLITKIMDAVNNK